MVNDNVVLLRGTGDFSNIYWDDYNFNRNGKYYEVYGVLNKINRKYKGHRAKVARVFFFLNPLVLFGCLFALVALYEVFNANCDLVCVYSMYCVIAFFFLGLLVKYDKQRFKVQV